MTELATGAKRSYASSKIIPGLVIDELAVGEEPKAFQSNGTTEAFGEFQSAVLSAIAWGVECPPEVLTLAFDSNYSASQAALNEFRQYVSRVRTFFGEGFCSPIYEEWLLSEVLDRHVDAPGFLDAYRDPRAVVQYGAWTSCDWAGAVKGLLDPTKLVRAYREGIAEGLITRDRAAREYSGMKYSKVVQQLTRENAALKEATDALGVVPSALRLADDDAPEFDPNGEPS